MRCGCNLKSVIFKLISSIDFLGHSCEIALWWMPQDLEHWWSVDIVSGNGFVFPGSMPLPVAMLSQFYVTLWYCQAPTSWMSWCASVQCWNIHDDHCEIFWGKKEFNVLDNRLSRLLTGWCIDSMYVANSNTNCQVVRDIRNSHNIHYKLKKVKREYIWYDMCNKPYLYIKVYHFED